MNKPKIHLTTITAHDAFTDCILTCQEGLRALGYDVHYQPEMLFRDELNILFCSQMLTWKTIKHCTNNRAIIYNWEPADPNIGRFVPGYLRQMINTHVWDYNAGNVQRLKAAGVQDIHHVPMGYVKEMQRVQAVEVQDIDVLFYGEINHRRSVVIDALRAKGLRVVTSDDTGRMTGEQRDQYIARAKVVLNIHLLESIQAFEIARVGYLLANKKAVVSELSELVDIEGDIRHAAAYGHTDDLPQLCWELVHDHARRHELEQKGFDIFSKRQARDILKPAIENYFEQLNQNPPLIGNQVTVNTPLPSTMQISPGVFWRYHMCNVDANADFAPDLPLNLSKPLPFGETLSSWRFGQVKLEPELFDKIIANKVFQRVDDPIRVLTNCLLLLKDGGTLEITVPLNMSLGAWSNIDDKRCFNEESWKHIINDDWWRYGWDTHRFDITRTSVSCYHGSGTQFLQENNNDWDLALRTPRIIDTQTIILRKRALNDEDKTMLPQIQFLD
ncbi:hypothetical protein [Hydromonas duriensis]|uniref:Uncharacterized protein n=1 Tax=Hydromonas duriensis TaxID=1527608 RepID=A0A4R6Y6A7_9BURK|nr:hypothetical protein [Hydromonas duriensis]TDR31008.1 hypothetical protein DFR44_11445 [Hydromonas duriensis]